MRVGISEAIRLYQCSTFLFKNYLKVIFITITLFLSILLISFSYCYIFLIKIIKTLNLVSFFLAIIPKDLVLKIKESDSHEIDEESDIDDETDQYISKEPFYNFEENEKFFE